MPSSVAHALVAAAVTAACYPTARPARLTGIAAAGAVLLDVDAVGRPFGLGDIAWLGGHRALTHSLAFAATAALLLAFRWRDHVPLPQRVRLWGCLALALASHGALDALTTYGEGVMFLAPVSAARFKAPWLPLRGVLPEALGLWAPALVLLTWRRWRVGRATVARAS